jgi:TRAP-type mannitol/chloroaromatic compound transport system permease small subunit
MRAYIGAYVRAVEGFNYRIGRFAMYIIFAMMAVLLWSSFTKTMPGMRPSLWTLETAQYLMVAYFILGGAYSIQLDANVRMDLVYGAFSLRRKAMLDIVTIFFLITYLCFLLAGGLNSFTYSLGNFADPPLAFLRDLGVAFTTGGADAAAEQLGYLERSRSVWRPVLWPVKLIMILGIVMMLLQAFAELFKDIERARTGESDPFGTAPRGRGHA